MLVKAAETECRDPCPGLEFDSPPIQTFMDDLTVTTASVPGCRWILQGLEKLICWTGMSFKPTKSSSMVLKRGKVVDKFHFFVDGVVRPSITEKPVTSLGKVFNCSLRDTASFQNTIKMQQCCTEGATTSASLEQPGGGIQSLLHWRGTSLSRIQ